MFKQSLPELLVSVVMIMLIILAFALYGPMSSSNSERKTRRHVVARYLLELETPRGHLLVGNHGEVSGLKKGQLRETDFNDLRQIIEKLQPGNGSGKWKLRYYDEKGRQEVLFDPTRADSHVLHLLENLRILGFEV